MYVRSAVALTSSANCRRGVFELYYIVIYVCICICIYIHTYTCMYIYIYNRLRWCTQRAHRLLASYQDASTMRNRE